MNDHHYGRKFPLIPRGLRLAALLLTAAALINLLAACDSDAPAVQAISATLPGESVVLLATDPATAAPPSRTPTATLTLTITPSVMPSPTVTASPTVTPSPSVTSSPTVTASPTLSPTPTSTPTPEPFTDHYSLHRPVPDGAASVVIDRVYPYGGTQRGAFQVHSGVEFFNPRFSPAIAAAAGTVYYAGSDRERIFGPSANYYGNVIVIDHGVRMPEGDTLYTLYGHLEDIDVMTGQRVERGQQIGRVGSTGIAIGSHLHFEVRIGDPDDFYSTRNPDLYLLPMPDTAMLVGRVTDPDGNLIPEVPVQLRRAGTNGRAIYETYSYGADVPNSSIVWGENFARGDIRPGDYEVYVSTLNGQTVFRETVTLDPANATFLEIVIPAGLQFYPSLNSQSTDETTPYPTPESSGTPQNFG
ncbi:MAG: peptidoglycan DD-metalloendopeptidase family protein [Chloroflexota bacterium]